MSDCMICMEPLQELWSPAQPCNCTLVVHRSCWTKWETFGDGVCLFCRQPIIRPQYRGIVVVYRIRTTVAVMETVCFLLVVYNSYLLFKFWLRYFPQDLEFLLHDEL